VVGGIILHIWKMTKRTQMGEEKKKLMLGIWKMTQKNPNWVKKKKHTHFRYLENDQKNQNG